MSSEAQVNTKHNPGACNRMEGQSSQTGTCARQGRWASAIASCAPPAHFSRGVVRMSAQFLHIT